MVRSYKFLFVPAFIIVWVIATYFILRQSMESDKEVLGTLMKRLQYLEQTSMDDATKYKRTMEKLEIVMKRSELLLQQLKAEATRESLLEKASKDGVVEIELNNDIQQPHLRGPGDYPDRVIEEKQYDKLPDIPHKTDFNGPVMPILVFACNRVSVTKCLDNLIEFRPNAEQFPIIVSQDCGDEATRNAILHYSDQVTLIQHPDNSDIEIPPKDKKFKGYYKISRHYGWALNKIFDHGYETVIIVEDDLNVASDFYEYFLGTYPLLRADPSLWCVSAWNDNGKIGLIDESSPELLYRTDFFPGLGWMMLKDLWQELAPKWPKSFWDDWIRHPEQRKGRSCIRPEISRTRTFGKIGVSHGLFFDKHLRFIKLSDAHIEFSKMNLTYLLQENYDRTFVANVYQTNLVTYEDLRRNLITTDKPVRIQYNTKDQYKKTAKMLGLMDDFRSGVPRMAYHGIVTFYYNAHRVHLAPNANWKGYDISWS